MTEPQNRDANDGRVGLVGKTLGRYRISAELGRGGMATVYRAFDPQLARDVAVKVIHGAFTGRGDIERRFQREAQAVAALKHECIVDVFDFAPGGDGEPAYIVSELVEGMTLRQLLERAGGRIVPEVAVLIAARVAAALGAAHARGIVHRDVKPDNIMIDLGQKKARARVLLTDFGIARMVEDDTMTATGSILGSPSYMSPEQARSGTIEPASDVFSLGATLYQMVVGRTPFHGKDPITVIAALVAGEFPRPGQVDARVGPELEAVILRCLKRQPAERYADGHALGVALRELAATSLPARVIADEAAALRDAHDDHAAFVRRIGGDVADACVERARAAARRGELSRSLAQINRALAYVPGHRGAEAVLATISSRRRWTKAGRDRRGAVPRGRRARGRAGARARARRRARRRERRARRRGACRRLRAAARDRAAPVARPLRRPRRRRPRARRRRRERGKRVVAPRVARDAARARGAPAPAAAAPVTAFRPSRARPARRRPRRRAEPAPTGGITLRARQGFCSPSLDDRAPALRPIYEGVAVGRHEVFCTLPGGDRLLAGTYDLRAGTHPDLIVLPGTDGRPKLGRPQ